MSNHNQRDRGQPPPTGQWERGRPLPKRTKTGESPRSPDASEARTRATSGWGRVRSAFKPPPPARFPIPLLLPCEILLIVAEMLPPEACACLVNCCSYMRGLYCEDGTFATEQLWGALLRRTFPQRYTGAPGPNAPPRLRGERDQVLNLLAKANEGQLQAAKSKRRPRQIVVLFKFFVQFHSALGGT